MPLLFLAVIWAAVLIPPMLRKLAEGRPADSITSFHHQLAVLRRAGPRVNRLADSAPSELPPEHRHVALVGSPVPAVAVPTWAGGRSLARRSSRRRRRDILMALLVAAGITLVGGALPSLRMLWLVHLVVDGLLAAYIALLVRQRNLATERQLKVRLLPAGRRHEAWHEPQGTWLEGDTAWLAREPALLRRSAN